MKLADTLAFAFIVSEHVPVPLQLPDQPENVYPEVGVAESTTELPAANVAEHVVPHEIPAGLLVTVPFDDDTESEKLVAVDVNIAPTLFAAFIVRLHAPVPLHAPVHPPNVEPVAGVAVSETVVPSVYESEHVFPHETELPETVPVPVPDFDTERRNVPATGGVVLRSPI